jgi:hypothetical protein
MRPARTNLKSVLYQAAGRGWCCHPTTPYSWGGRAQVLTRVLAYFANPHNVTRTFMLAIVDIGIELWTSAQQRRRDVLPRIRRSLGYAFARAFTTVVQRDLQVQVVEFDILCGRPVEGRPSCGRLSRRWPRDPAWWAEPPDSLLTGAPRAAIGRVLRRRWW